MAWTSDRRWWLAEDGETVVEDGHIRATTLLVGVGGTLSDEDAKRYGLVAEPKAKAPPPANKARDVTEKKI